MPLLVLDRRKRASLQTQLSGGLKNLVRTRILQPGQTIPSTRELARDLHISRNTVIQAYDRLIGEGFLESSPRRGVRVSESVALLSPRPPVPASPRMNGSRDEIGPPKPFQPCQPDVRLFPLAMWNRMRTRALKRAGADLLGYQSHLPLGLPALRRALAVYLRESRGVHCDWRQIAITSGSQLALFLLAQLLLSTKSRVVMEDPGYRGARAAWQHAGARIDPQPVDSAGMTIPRATPADLIYTTPSRQFPTGACLSLGRRLALVELAARCKAWIVEDDYDSEFRYTRPPLPSLQSLDTSRRVIYTGSMSKVLLPALRIGYVVLPAALVEGFSVLRGTLDDHGPLIDQAALAEFIDSGAFYRHIRRSRSAYAERLETFVESVSRIGLPLTFPHTDGGMNLAGFLDPAASDRQYSTRLSDRGIEAPPLSLYSLRSTRPGLLFGFTAFTPQTIRQRLNALAISGAAYSSNSDSNRR
jgi:GntR family transcriptional regulator / MocR family aminotransferase